MIPQPRVVCEEFGRLLTTGAETILTEVKVLWEKAIEYSLFDLALKFG